ncbi:MAG: undecaprenyldiphospho-muramoylpentapeptide beta-N-acetylglucosaminyltransferase [Bdellovibrionia bacterium]
MGKKNIVIAGGGTGGHIYPGIAIAKALQKFDPEIQIHFVGTKEGMETKIIPREGYPLVLIESGKLNFRGNFLKKIKSLLKIPVGIFQSIRVLWQLKPLYVIGVGGYASAPMVLAASFVGFPSAVWEPNAMPGLANRLLSRFVDKCFVVFEDAKSHLKNKQVIRTGMPIRSEIEHAAKDETQNHKFRLLAFGGSSGARTLNYCLQNALLKNQEWAKDIAIVHQTGSLDYQEIKSKYVDYKGELDIKEFIFDMPNYYQWADVAFCRGGASSLAEVAAYGLVPIIVPLPLADDHQQKNAETLVNAGAAIMILQKDLTPDVLIENILRLKNNPEMRRTMSQKLRTFYVPQAAEAIAKEILS